MRLRQIEIFYHVYRQGSISGAARELHVSQPSVSKVLRYAEDQLGFLLFTREKARLYPTPAAHELFSEVKDIYGRIGSFNRTASNIKKRKGGHIRFGVLPSLGLNIVPECIARLRISNPEMSFELTTLHSDELNSAVTEKKCDICLGFASEPDVRLEIKQLAQGQLLLMAKKDQRVNGDGKVDLSILEGKEFIGIKDSGPLAAILANALEKSDVHPNEVVTAHTYHVALSLVRKGLGLTVSDQFTANSELGRDLRKYHFEERLEYPICAIWLKHNQQQKLIDDCIVSIRDVVKSELLQ